MGTAQSSLSPTVDLESIKEAYPFDIEEFEAVDTLGTGSYARVDLIQHRTTREKFAFKVLLDFGEENEFKDDFLNEISLLSSIHHPTIVAFHGFSDKDGKLAYAFEYAENGSLCDLFDDKALGISDVELTPTNKTIIAYGVALALLYLHTEAASNAQIIHRDLKSGNILLNSFLEPKLGDFGFTKIINKTGYNTGQRGSWPWMAPEVMESSGYGAAADVYSYGMLLYELLVEHIPFANITTAIDFVNRVAVNGERPPMPENVGEIRTLIEACWAQDPAGRPSFEIIAKAIQSGKFVYSGTDMEKVHAYEASLRLCEVETDTVKTNQ